jgi:DNA-binding MarR family transcriptional regulator
MSESSENVRDEALKSIETLLVAISVRSLPHRVGSLLEARLTLKQLRALTTLAGTQTLTLTSLAADFEVSLPTMSGILDKLVQRDLVERVENHEDQRSRPLRLTALGQAVIGEIVAPDPHLGSEIVAGMDTSELAALEVALAAVNRELRRVTEEG